MDKNKTESVCCMTLPGGVLKTQVKSVRAKGDERLQNNTDQSSEAEGQTV